MSHSHSHSHHHDRGSGRPGRITVVLLAVAAALTVAGMALLRPRDAPAGQGAEQAAGGPARVLGDVVRVTEQPCAEGDPAKVCGTVDVKLDSGQSVTTELPNGPGSITPEVGDPIVLLLLEDAPGGPTGYSIVDFQRTTPLWMLGAAFALAVVAFGRWRGLAALAGLAVTFGILLWFIVPAILAGRSPIMVAVVGAAAIMLLVLYLTHGFTTTTSVAVAGTLVSLTLTAVLSAVATAMTRLSGVADETANYLTITQGDVNMRGLLLAGIVIGSLGVLDDVTVTQSATVAELSLANPGYGFRRLYGAATRIGRAHIASVINTIVLAYAGASLPLMLLFAAGGTPVSELLTGELIAQELVRSAVGTIGLITAVPITTALAALIAARARPAAPSAPAPPRAGRPGGDPWAAFVERDRG